MTDLIQADLSPPRRVLVVDDNETDQELMALTLDAAFPGIAVVLNGDPLAAQRLCEESGFDCVLVDYNMPDKDGLTLVGELRAAFAHLPIILMTNVGDEMLAASALRQGASDYLPKAKVSAFSIRRAVDRSIQACGRERLIEEQRGELENFAYALAHDFKQPIRQIITFSEMISEEIGGRGGAVRQHLTFLSTAAGRLGRLVDVMTQYTLLNRPPELGVVELKAVVADVRASLAPYLAERGATFLAPSKLPAVLGNETLMIQVLQNLVFNGLHYNRDPAPCVELRIGQRDDAWVLEVHDNGVGIEPQYLTEIFKPLVRLHNAADFAGTGLGLTLARKAAVAQGGAIWCESVLGAGSVFFVQARRAGGQFSSKPRCATAAPLALEKAKSSPRSTGVGSA
jgi:signal transduction histidine kinase